MTRLYRVPGDRRGAGPIIVRHPRPFDEPQDGIVVTAPGAKAHMAWGSMGHLLAMLEHPEARHVLHCPYGGTITTSPGTLHTGHPGVAVTISGVSVTLCPDKVARVGWACAKLMADHMGGNFRQAEKNAWRLKRMVARELRAAP